MVERLASEHHEVVVSRRDIADAFPKVIEHTERPLLRTAPAPLFLLSNLVQSHGIKVVLTGEGADEMFGGYDIFREGKVRRYWAKDPSSKQRPLLLDRLYPYLARSPVAQRAMAARFFGRKLEEHHAPGFAHEPRWHTTSALKRFYATSLREQLGSTNVVADLLGSLPDDFHRWSKLAQDQHLEIRTLLSSYILCSQGDRMLMAHSVEGRFPFLDINVTALAASLPHHYKLRVLDEKHVLKRAARSFIPTEILERPKQPYRAPDALSFVAAGAGKWIEDLLAPSEVQKVGIFDPAPVEALWKKLHTRRDEAQVSNTDNMALVAVLSTQHLHARVLHATARDDESLVWRTLVDKATQP